jgi:hypothetical protein
MFILDGFKGTTVKLDFRDGDLYGVLSLLSETAHLDGIFIFVDQRIKGKIQIAMDEPWNNILVEILTGVNFVTVLSGNFIAISLPEEKL